jgi:hypothetical protein
MAVATFRNPGALPKSATLDNERHNMMQGGLAEASQDSQQSMPTKRLLLFHNLLGSSRALVTQVGVVELLQNTRLPPG